MLKSVTYKYAETTDFWKWFHNYAEFRKEQFVDGLSWQLWHNDSLEIDQYDNPNTHYSFVVDGNKLIAAARLIPSDPAWYGWHNLLVDAEAGRVPTVAPGIFPKGYDFSNTWECSRLVTNPLLPGADRLTSFKLLVGGLVRIGKQNSARALLSLSPPPLRRSLRLAGYRAQRIGTPYQCAEDNKDYCALEMTIDRVSGSSCGFPADKGAFPYKERKPSRSAVPVT